MVSFQYRYMPIPRLQLFDWIIRIVKIENQISVLKVSREQINNQAEQYLTEYGNSILRFAYSYLHDMDDAEEILQEAMIQFLKYAPSFENENHAKAWFLRVTANLSKNRIRYNRHRATDELNEMIVAEQKEDLSFVWEAVKSLPLNYREVIHLFYQEGYTTTQIAEILGRKESTIRSHLLRGRSKLKEILREEYDFDENGAL
ncbi:MAG: RNA polymerase sigma factor [Candidatus Merdivicinus sp.]